MFSVYFPRQCVWFLMGFRFLTHQSCAVLCCVTQVLRTASAAGSQAHCSPTAFQLVNQLQKESGQPGRHCQRDPGCEGQRGGRGSVAEVGVTVTASHRWKPKTPPHPHHSLSVTMVISLQPIPTFQPPPQPPFQSIPVWQILQYGR